MLPHSFQVSAIDAYLRKAGGSERISRLSVLFGVDEAWESGDVLLLTLKQLPGRLGTTFLRLRGGPVGLCWFKDTFVWGGGQQHLG